MSQWLNETRNELRSVKVVKENSVSFRTEIRAGIRILGFGLGLDLELS